LSPSSAVDGWRRFGDPRFRTYHYLALAQGVVGVLAVSALTGEGIDELKRTLFALCPEAPPEALPDELPEFLEYRPKPEGPRPYRIYRTDRGYRIVGDAPKGDELEAALKAAGVRAGQEVEIGDEVSVWE